MKWKYKNGVHDLIFTSDDIEKMKNGIIISLKTHNQDLIIVHRVD